MSGDEVFALIVSAIIGIVGWRSWLGGLLLLQPLSRKPATQFLGWLSPLAAGAALLFVLFKWSSSDVRDAPIYIFFYMVMGFGWAGLWNLILPFAGLSFRDDALELDNDSAGLAIAGSLVGVTLAFFCALLGTGVMLILWMVGAGITRVADAITIDRDISAGWRAAGFFIGSGLILGRAVAGDWHSANETVMDFLAHGWPVLILWAITLALDKVCGPTPQRPAPNSFMFGVMPFVLLMGISLGAVLVEGSW